MRYNEESSHLENFVSNADWINLREDSEGPGKLGKHNVPLTVSPLLSLPLLSLQLMYIPPTSLFLLFPLVSCPLILYM